MCGLITVAGDMFSSDISRFTDLVTVTYLRGQDATGVATVFQNSVKVHKKPTSPRYFFQSEYKELKELLNTAAYAILGHARQATTGGKDALSAHPFVSGNIVGMHNGHVETSILNDLPERFNTPTDSEEIIRNISKHGAEATLEYLRGAFALVWFDRKTSRLNFVRNDKRSLYYALSGDGKTIWLHSELGALRWILERDGGSRSYTYQEVKEGKLYSIYVTNKGVKDMKIVDVAMGKYKSHPKPMVWTPTSDEAKRLQEKLSRSTALTTTGGVTPHIAPKAPIRTPSDINKNLPMNEDFSIIEDVPMFLPEELREFDYGQLQTYKGRVEEALKRVTAKLGTVRALSSINWADQATWRGNLRQSVKKIITTGKLNSEKLDTLRIALHRTKARIDSYERIKDIAERNRNVLDVVSPVPNQNLREFKTLGDMFTNMHQLSEFLSKHKGCACCSDDNPTNFLVAKSILLKDGFVCSNCAEADNVLEEIIEPYAVRR